MFDSREENVAILYLTGESDEFDGGLYIYENYGKDKNKILFEDIYDIWHKRENP